MNFGAQLSCNRFLTNNPIPVYHTRFKVLFKNLPHCLTNPIGCHLIQEFASLFDQPNRLPPPRCHCHTIPLIQEQHLFRLRPYRYNPAQKDEIERQIADLLHKGMIQPSCSPFVSPIILARKKTGDWRLCVDCRCLNALTIKISILFQFLL
jgi:hypothetical protein